LSRREKLLLRFLSKPRDFNFDDLRTLLRRFGYEEVTAGLTSGSRAAFCRPCDGHIVRLHKPHPVSILKRYQLDAVESRLRTKGLLK